MPENDMSPVSNYSTCGWERLRMTYMLSFLSPASTSADEKYRETAIIAAALTSRPVVCTIPAPASFRNVNAKTVVKAATESSEIRSVAWLASVLIEL